MAQEDLNILYPKQRNVGWLKYSDAHNSLYHHLAGEAIKLIDSKEAKASPKTFSEWQKRQSEIKDIMWELLGPFPQKTPLNAKITGTVKKNEYRIENIIYESLPGFYVTSSLFIPDKLKKKAPAILFCSGHSAGAYRLESYQMPLLNLVKKGFIVLAIDPLGQGERLQYLNKETGGSLIGSSTQEHSYSSPQLSLIGQSVARYFVWDGIRGIDYLLSRKEVDPKRIGVHGLSGGGVQTAYIAALDDRVAASAPAGYITSYKFLLESIGPQDGEQNLYHGLVRGIDHFDYVVSFAPKPMLIMATTRDFFSIQGTRETFKKARQVYDLFGKAENIEITEDDHGHGYTKKNREAMYAFFQKHLMVPGSPVEEDVVFASPEELQKTTTGQLGSSMEGETVFSLNLKEIEKAVDKLNASRNELKSHLAAVPKEARRYSGYREPSLSDEPIFAGKYPRTDYDVLKYLVKGEGDYVIPYLLFSPYKSNGEAILYLHPSGKLAESSEGSEIEQFVKKGYTVLAPDLIGTGELGAGIFKGDAFIQNVSYNLFFSAMMIGRSIVGVQAADINKLTSVLKFKANHNINEVHAIAKKEMCPSLIHAAVFNGEIKQIALIEPYSSYGSIATGCYYNSAFVHSIVPGALKAYDLPDLAACLAPRKLSIVGVTDGNGKPLDEATMQAELEIIRKSYQMNNAGNQLKLLPGSPQNPLEVLFNDK